jgi:hypothetical protein
LLVTSLVLDSQENFPSTPLQSSMEIDLSPVISFGY